MSGAEPRAALLTRILTRETWIAAACLAILLALAWWWLWRMAAPGAGMAMEGMAGMAMPSSPDVWSPAYLAPAFLMWAIMMVAMMLPSATPMILFHAGFARRSGGSARAATIVFALTYLLLWAGFAVLAALGQALLIGAGLLAQASLALGDRTLAAALLVVTALYQLSGLKRRCLAWCRSPVAFLTRHWRPGVAGAVRMGVAHGLHCIGCCALLMLLLFVGGVMNLAWVAALTLLVLVEKYAPARFHADRLIAAALLVASGALLLR